MTPLVPPKRIQLCKLGSKSHRTSGVNDAASMTRLVRNDTAGAEELEFARLWLPLKGISIKKIYIGQLYYPIDITITQKYRGYLRIIFGSSGVIETAGAKIGDFIVEYLREFEAICKEALKLFRIWRPH
jgi:hypothetical protein